MSQRDPTKYLLPMLTGAGQVVIGVLFLARIAGDTLSGVLGIACLILGVLSLLLAARGYRREKARND